MGNQQVKVVKEHIVDCPFEQFNEKETIEFLIKRSKVYRDYGDDHTANRADTSRWNAILTLILRRRSLIFAGLGEMMSKLKQEKSCQHHHRRTDLQHSAY